MTYDKHKIPKICRKISPGSRVLDDAIVDIIYLTNVMKCVATQNANLLKTRLCDSSAIPTDRRNIITSFVYICCR